MVANISADWNYCSVCGNKMHETYTETTWFDRKSGLKAIERKYYWVCSKVNTIRGRLDGNQHDTSLNTDSSPFREERLWDDAPTVE